MLHTLTTHSPQTESMRSRQILRLKCPYCGKYAGHRVITTDPKHYRWSEESTSMFIRIVGQDIAFRQRTRECQSCYTRFDTVEMWEDYLSSLMCEMRRLESDNATLKLALQESASKINRLLTISSQIEQLAEEQCNSVNSIRSVVTEHDRLLNMSLAELELSDRATRCLESEGITTVRDLVVRSEEELLEIRNFGDSTLREVKEHLAERNLCLGMQLRP